MKYRINSENYHSFETIEINKLRGRSYFIPYPDRAKADAVSLKEKRYRSEKVLCLNGDWDFKFFPKPAEARSTYRPAGSSAAMTDRFMSTSAISSPMIRL